MARLHEYTYLYLHPPTHTSWSDLSRYLPLFNTDRQLCPIHCFAWRDDSTDVWTSRRSQTWCHPAKVILTARKNAVVTSCCLCVWGSGIPLATQSIQRCQQNPCTEKMEPGIAMRTCRISVEHGFKLVKTLFVHLRYLCVCTTSFCQPYSKPIHYLQCPGLTNMHNCLQLN